VFPAQRFARHTKLQVDSFISRAYSRLGTGTLARSTFTDLLSAVRRRSPSRLCAAIVDGHHAGVDALFNLAAYADSHYRHVSSWGPGHVHRGKGRSPLSRSIFSAATPYRDFLLRPGTQLLVPAPMRNAAGT